MKTEPGPQIHDSALRGFLRNLAMGGLAILVFGLGRRNRRLGGDHSCVNRGICRRCRLYRGCGLPQAELARRDTRRRPA